MEIVDGAVLGLNVHIAGRIAALAEADEILASSTMRDLTAGSGPCFEERRTHQLRAVPQAAHRVARRRLDTSGHSKRNMIS
jgi:class 3 adenylate cyclase